MPKIISFFLTLVVMGGAAASCSRKVEEAKPVATPSVTLSRTDAAVGSPVDVTYKFTVASDAPPFAEDYIVFVHFIDADGEQMWTDDHEPSTPTRQWKPGQTIEYQRTIFIPKFPYVGMTDVALGLYSRTSGERLPLAGQDRGMRAYNVAKFNMTFQSEDRKSVV